MFHFSELWGIHQSDALLFDWLPVGFAYHASLGIVYIGSFVLLYYNWPDTAVEERIGETKEIPEEEPADRGAIVGDDSVEAGNGGVSMSETSKEGTEQ